MTRGLTAGEAICPGIAVGSLHLSVPCFPMLWQILSLHEMDPLSFLRSSLIHLDETDHAPGSALGAALHAVGKQNGIVAGCMAA